MVLLPEKCRDELNHYFPRSTRQFGEVHGWIFKNILSKSKFYNDFKIWSKKNIEGSLKGGTHFTNIRNQGNELFPVHIFKFCHQSRSPYKSKQEAVSLFTTSHSVKVYTKWKQARPSERQQVIHTLCPGYLKESLSTLTGPASRGDGSHHHLERRNQPVSLEPLLWSRPEWPCPGEFTPGELTGWMASLYSRQLKKQYVARAVEPSG